MQQLPLTACERCGHALAADQLVCPNCGLFVHHRRLDELASQAMQMEQTNPAGAAVVWQQMLPLMPPESPQFQQISQRIGALASGWAPAAGPAAPAGPRPVRPPDPLPVAISKTLGSMVLSAVVYYFLLFRDWPVAIGFVVLMLIHEMGHVFAMRYYRLSASPPIFIPFLGALINLRQNPPNALVESVVGIGGPMLGTIGALICYAIALSTHGDLRIELLIVAQLAFILNLFNLLPIPPLDGGRITAAITPWLWIAGLVGLGLLMFEEARNDGVFGLIIPFLILFYALPRIRMTLRARGMHIPYYNISKTASWTMAALYISLGVVLVFMFHHLGGLSFLERGTG
ncbi:MAG TPA: site-2 protease family protein [Tepidisphaeraceae bacterium]|nr:site-2 protease family protein [Tepidisphaeraceae bacterium]